MRRINSNLPGVFILEPAVFADERGFFFESYRQDKFRDLGFEVTFVQDNHSRSRRGVLRGLHYQLEHPQAKLCRVIRGEVLDVVVDIRPDSPNFRRWVSISLNADNKREVFVPAGYAHGFAALSDSEFLYKCSDFYHPEDEHGVLWSDPDLKIDWKLANPQIAPKDAAFRPLREIDPRHLPRYQKSS